MIHQEIQPGALYTRRAFLPFGKEKGSQHYQEQFCILCPTLPPSPASLSGLISPRIKGAAVLCTLVLSPTEANKPPPRWRTSGHSGGSTWCHRRGGGESFWGPRAVMPSHLNQQPKGGHAFSVTHVLIAQLRGWKKGCCTPLSLRKIEHSLKFSQDFADHQQLAAYQSAWLGLLWHFNSAVI